MKLELVEPGVYLMDVRQKMLPRPKEALAMASSFFGQFGENEKKVIEVLIDFSVRHNAWVGVSRFWLIEGFFNKDQFAFFSDDVDLSINTLISNRFLGITGYKKWYLKWLNVFSDRIIYPTRLLLEKLQLIKSVER
jgi:hypothetical protein